MGARGGRHYNCMGDNSESSFPRAGKLNNNHVLSWLKETTKSLMLSPVSVGL